VECNGRARECKGRARASGGVQWAGKGGRGAGNKSHEAWIRGRDASWRGARRGSARRTASRSARRAERRSGRWSRMAPMPGSTRSLQCCSPQMQFHPPALAKLTLACSPQRTALTPALQTHAPAELGGAGGVERWPWSQPHAHAKQRAKEPSAPAVSPVSPPLGTQPGGGEAAALALLAHGPDA
jgi:hypothetical protein